MVITLVWDYTTLLGGGAKYSYGKYVYGWAWNFIIQLKAAHLHGTLKMKCQTK